ncbi:MAG: hypothetical protein M3413_01245 [Bacteroidota bacterium]|nr:hypothetical protein [Flavisolibacter sp.]MDQ3550131.1 hypothetical protein [Bacteroidota bacterium]
MRKLLTPKTIFFLALGILLISFFFLLNHVSGDCIAGSECTQSIKPELLWEPLSQQFITTISPY